MLARFRKSGVVRSVTGDKGTFRRMRRHKSCDTEGVKHPTTSNDTDTCTCTTGNAIESVPIGKRTFRRMRRTRSCEPGKEPERQSSSPSDTTNCTTDSSSDEADNGMTIRWQRTPSGHVPTPQQQEQARRQTRMKELPSTAAFSSNHILVNRERIHRGKAPLIRCRHLDAIAKKHAEEMADACALLENPILSVTMAENVVRGPSIRVIHQMIMVGVSDHERDNILSDRFARFGMGTAPGGDGMIYMSQVFQASVARRRPTC